MPVGYTPHRSVQVLGFDDFGHLTPMRRLVPRWPMPGANATQLADWLSKASTRLSRQQRPRHQPKLTVQGITLSQIHPVLDARNRPILEPTAFDINTSIQRCLVKAIALHGLGLYVYAGEDLPQPVTPDAANDATPVQDWPDLSPNRPPAIRPGGSARISKSQQTHVHKLAVEVGISLDRVLAYFGVTDLGEIAAIDFPRVIRSLEKHRKAA